MSLALFAAAALAPQAPLSAQLPLSAQGRVLDVLGEPVPAAVVWATDAQGRELCRATSDGTGVFLIRALPRDGALALHVNASGKVEWSTALAPQRSFAATIVLEDAGSLHGVVRNAAGAPIAGAHVVGWAQRLVPIGGGPWQQETVADANGEFAFAAAPLRPGAVCAWAPGYELATVGCVRDGGPFAVTLNAGPREPRVVRVDGMPAGTAVTVAVEFGGRDAPPLPAPLRGAVVQSDGTASLWPLPFLHFVSVHADGFSSRPLGCRVAAGSTAECRFVLTPVPPEVRAPHTTIHGRVVDALGHPLAGLEVIAGGSESRIVANTTSGADGAFTIDVPVRVPVLCALGLAPGPFRIGDPQARDGEDGISWLDVPADPTKTVLLHSLPAATIRGATRVPFARIEVAEVQPKNVFDRRASATTDAVGQFEVRGLPGGEYRVFVHLGYLQLAFADVHVGDGGTETVGPLQVPPSGELTGVVRDGAGNAAAGVLIQAGAVDGANPWRGVFHGIGVQPLPVLTDRNGRYRMRGLPAGTWGLEYGVAAPGHARPAETETVVAGGVATHDITLPK
jgi:hypothetical protein